jgi:hypothetical protein
MRDFESLPERRTAFHLVIMMIFSVSKANSDGVYKCVFELCHESFSDPMAMLRHFLLCTYARGGQSYWCHTKHQLETFPYTEESTYNPYNPPIYTDSANEHESNSDEWCHFASSLSTSTRHRAQPLRDEDWDKYKDAIQELYLTQNKTLKDVKQIMKDAHGFSATYAISPQNECSR